LVNVFDNVMINSISNVVVPVAGGSSGSSLHAAQGRASELCNRQQMEGPHCTFKRRVTWSMQLKQ
jgi:hypothetical protein